MVIEGEPRSSWPASGCPQPSSSCAIATGAGGQHVRQGRPRPASARRRVRPRRRPGHRGGRPHRTGGDDAARPARGRRRRRRDPRRRRRRNLRRPRSRGGTRPRRRRRLGRHALHRDARGEGTSRLQGPPPRDREDGTTISRASRERPCACCATPTPTLRRAPEELKAFPEQLWQSLSDGTFHLGGGEDTPGVDPSARATRLARASGASTSWSRRVLVARMVAEARLLSGAPPAPSARRPLFLPPSSPPLRIRSLPREPLTSHR